MRESSIVTPVRTQDERGSGNGAGKVCTPCRRGCSRQRRKERAADIGGGLPLQVCAAGVRKMHWPLSGQGRLSLASADAAGRRRSLPRAFCRWPPLAVSAGRRACESREKYLPQALTKLHGCGILFWTTKQNRLAVLTSRFRLLRSIGHTRLDIGR